MTSENKSENDSPPTVPLEKAKTASNQASLAMELPFTLVAAVVFGGGLGYFLDRWLHTKAIFMILLGGLGFFAGVREVIRRLSASSDG
ncbi:MAG TPA: AtpZ/AtpI family protein [Candidatus Eremiobacteraceae bacterium]|nr:AtpZ/AtpI family protein [Candidatus Eremiobacteraceae bacterium]